MMMRLRDPRLLPFLVVPLASTFTAPYVWLGWLLGSASMLAMTAWRKQLGAPITSPHALLPAGIAFTISLRVGYPLLGVALIVTILTGWNLRSSLERAWPFGE